MHKPPARSDRLEAADPPVLIAILIAARRTGDRLLENIARRELEQRHRIKLRFLRDPEGTSCKA